MNKNVTNIYDQQIYTISCCMDNITIFCVFFSFKQ